MKLPLARVRPSHPFWSVGTFLAWLTLLPPLVWWASVVLPVWMPSLWNFLLPVLPANLWPDAFFVFVGSALAALSSFGAALWLDLN